MAKVANRVAGKQHPHPHGVKKGSTAHKARATTRDMKVSVSDGFKDIREMNRKILHSLKY